MKILFVGARVVGYRCLQAILEAGHEVVALLTLDESRRERTTAFYSYTPIIERYRLPTFKFIHLQGNDPVRWSQQYRPTLGVVAGVSQLLPQALLDVPAQGFIGMHPTLLPKGRGRAPIPWALIKGFRATGVTWFQCVAQADQGDVLLQQSVPIYYEDTSQTLGARTDDVAVELLLSVLG